MDNKNIFFIISHKVVVIPDVNLHKAEKREFRLAHQKNRVRIPAVPSRCNSLQRTQDLQTGYTLRIVGPL